MKTQPITSFALRYRIPILLISGLILLAAIIPLLQISVNSDLESYMPDTMQSKQNNRLISKHFTTSENLLITVEAPDILATNTLERLEAISMGLESLPFVTRVHSLFQTRNIHSEDGFMQVDPVIPFIPETEEDRETLRNELLSNDLAVGLVVSEDFHHALILLDLQRDTTDSNADAQMLRQVRAVFEATPGPEVIRITGQPYLRDDANKKISRDILILLPLGLLVMLIFLWFSFRELKAVLLPFSVVIFSIIVSLALLPALGWELSLIGILIPIMMIAIANNYGIHVISRYQEVSSLHPDLHHSAAIDQSIKYLQKPVWLCGLTTIAGTLGLTAHLLTPARQMGIVTALGIGFALLMSLTYLPALMSFFTPASTGDKPSGHRLRKLLTHTGKHSLRHPGWYIISAAVILIVGLVGITRLSVAPDSSKILPYDHEFNKTIRIADQQFGGSKLLQIMIKGDARDPNLLRAIDAVANQLEDDPLVGHAASLAVMVRKMNAGSLPDSREAIAQYLELYGMSADVADYERFLNFSYTYSLLSLQYKSANLQEINALLDKVQELMDNHQLNYVIGGVSLVDKEISESVRTGQISSLIAAMLAIIILLSIIFKSITAGLLGSIPLTFSVICTFGFMGWIGIELDIVTALLSSISIGLGVDFTIHVFWRMKTELHSHNDWSAAIINTLRGTGRGITINAFSVMLGFSVLLFSSFPFVQSFGFLIILSLALCLVSALLIIPIVSLLLKPRFLTH